VDILRCSGVSRALVSSGTSSLFALGAPPGVCGWLIRLRDPLRAQRAANIVYLRNCSLSPSGNYEKFFRSGAKTFAHILDPATGKPVENMLATSVLAPRACDADALSTAFFVMDVHCAQNYISTHDNLVALFYLPRSEGRRFRRVILRSVASSGRGGVFIRIRDTERRAARTRA
jgi:thiamine biosynthesis lipoprotein